MVSQLEDGEEALQTRIHVTVESVILHADWLTPHGWHPFVSFSQSHLHLLGVFIRTLNFNFHFMLTELIILADYGTTPVNIGPKHVQVFAYVEVRWLLTSIMFKSLCSKIFQKFSVVDGPWWIRPTLILNPIDPFLNPSVVKGIVSPLVIWISLNNFHDPLLLLQSLL